GRDGHALPALPPVARRVAVEAGGVDRAEVPDADPPSLAADRRGRRHPGLRAEVQAPRRPGDRRSRPIKRLRPLVGAAAAGLAWGHFEAGWVRFRVLSVPLPRL